VIVADSSVWIAAMRGSNSPTIEAFHIAALDGSLLVGDLIMLEVLQGAHGDAHARLLERAMRQHPVVSLLDDKLAAKAAAHFRQLRARGITIRKTVDLIIATFCLDRDHVLLHQDRDFTPFAYHLGLRVF
jgi:predicted nucleic acid-binding protein